MNLMGETFLQQKKHGFQSVPSCPQTYKENISDNTAVRFNCAKCFWHIGVLFVHFFVCQSTFSKFVLSISPQLATRLLAHKIQSPQEWEAMQALTVSGHPSEAHAAHVPEMHWDYEWKKSFQGFGDMHEERWKGILQWSGQVPLSQWAHQSGFTQGNDSCLTED